MTAGIGSMPPTRGTPEHSVTLVWIDSREAFVVRWLSGEAKVDRVESDVPTHHRSTGHVRHDPGRRQGGGGVLQAAVEGHRLEHLARFVAGVAQLLPGEDALLLIGPGTVREHLANHVAEIDERRHVTRGVTCRPARPMTVPQLVALLRREIGHELPRKAIRRRRPIRRPPSRQEAREFAELIADEEM